MPAIRTGPRQPRKWSPNSAFNIIVGGLMVVAAVSSTRLYRSDSDEDPFLVTNPDPTMTLDASTKSKRLKLGGKSMVNCLAASCWLSMYADTIPS